VAAASYERKSVSVHSLSSRPAVKVLEVFPKTVSFNAVTVRVKVALVHHPDKSTVATVTFGWLRIVEVAMMITP
jgi:hypothetical protein